MDISRRLFSTALPAILASALVGGGGRATAQESPTPVAERPGPGAEATIACEYRGDESFAGTGIDAKPAAGVFHYQLYLPSGFAADAEHPAVFLMSPGGQARPAALKRFADEAGWIIAALQEAKNGPWEPIIGNFLAAHDDLVRRCKVAATRKFATGFSGGARGSSMFVQMRPGFRGVLLQGAGFWFDDGKYGIKGLPRDCRVAMIMGEQDKNRAEIARLREALPKAQQFKVWEWSGGHQKPPDAMLTEALLWIGAEP